MSRFENLITSHNEIYVIINNFKCKFKNAKDNIELVENIKEFKICIIPVLDNAFAIDEKTLLPIFQLKEESVSIKCILDLHKYIFTKLENLKDLLRDYEIFEKDYIAEELLDCAYDIMDDIYNYAYSEDCIFSTFLSFDLSDEEKLIIARELARISCNLKMYE